MTIIDRKPLVLGFAGPTCTGKTTVASSIARKLGGQVISLESYYLDQTHLSMSERMKANYDAPDSIDRALLVEHVESLASGRDIQVPIYDFAEHTRVPGRCQPVKSCPVLIVEGILVLHWFDLRAMFDKSFYFDAPSELCLQRRRVRDIVERERAHEFVVRQYQEKVLPMAERYVFPTKSFADVVIDARRSLNDIETEVLTQIRPLQIAIGTRA